MTNSMFDAFKFISAVILADLWHPNRAPETEAGLRHGHDISNRCAGLHRGHPISNCCEPLPPPSSSDGHGESRSEQNPQVPLASEDAFAQVPGNAETAVGNPFKFAICDLRLTQPSPSIA